MLETQKDIDAVVIATPDHLHAVVSMMALKLGKHVHCQKPLTHSVYEARALGKAAKEAKVATQMGNQGQASEEHRLMAELVWAGAVGTVREVHAGSNRYPPISPRGIPRPKETPAGAGDAELGPLGGAVADAALPPLPTILSPGAAGGISAPACLGDIACHELSPVFKALKLPIGIPTGSRPARRTTSARRRSAASRRRCRRSPAGTSPPRATPRR